MTETEELRAIVTDLIEVLRLQARELEGLVAHVEQVTSHLPNPHQFSAVAAVLTGLHQRVQKLESMPQR